MLETIDYSSSWLRQITNQVHTVLTAVDGEKWPDMELNRWGNTSSVEISEKVKRNMRFNTQRAKRCAWRQFMDFCRARTYTIGEKTTNGELCDILKDYAYNMRRRDGTDYKETVVKFNWNMVAKMLQDKFFTEFQRKFDPFSDIDFKAAREARDAKRKELQSKLDKRRQSSSVLTSEESIKLQKFWNEETPEGLQKKFYLVAAKQLVWRGHEGANVKLHFFRIERDIFGNRTGRIEYNPTLTKDNQASPSAASKWLMTNKTDPDICAVRLFHKLVEKRPTHISTDRLFLTPNPKWNVEFNVGWYKNTPIGVNTMSKWTQDTARRVGLNDDTKKITNMSYRAIAPKDQRASEQEVVNVGGANSNSLLLYFNVPAGVPEESVFLEDQSSNGSQVALMVPKEEEEDVDDDLSVEEESVDDKVLVDSQVIKIEDNVDEDSNSHCVKECTHTCHFKNEYDIIAKVWAQELKKMSPDQQIFAKRAINDILYEGQLGLLHNRK